MKIIDSELVVGVVGGMGPLATADLLVKLAQATPVSLEQDHLHVLIDSNAKIPDRNKAISGGGDSPGPVLASMAIGLERAGAGLIVMACNTAHAFEGAVRAVLSVPFVSIVEEACDACVREYPFAKRIGILAAPGCIDASLYQTALFKRGLSAVTLTPESQLRFSELLYSIKLNEPIEEIKLSMKELAHSLIDSGAELLIAGCTEVPLVLKKGDLSVPLIDATANLAQRCVLYARGLESLPHHALPFSNYI